MKASNTLVTGCMTGVLLVCQLIMYRDTQQWSSIGKVDDLFCGLWLWCQISHMSYPATKSQSILLHNLDTIKLWTKILVQEDHNCCII